MLFHEELDYADHAATITILAAVSVSLQGPV